jgi:hypothetical protein
MPPVRCEPASCPLAEQMVEILLESPTPAEVIACAEARDFAG